MDTELLGRLRDGDEEAFVLLVGRYQQPMLRLARSMVASQRWPKRRCRDTWMGVVRGIDRFEGARRSRLAVSDPGLSSPIAGSREPADVSIDALHSVDPSRFDAQGGGPITPIVGEEIDDRSTPTVVAVLKAAVEKLPARQRQIVLLRMSRSIQCGGMRRVGD